MTRERKSKMKRWQKGFMAAVMMVLAATVLGCGKSDTTPKKASDAPAKTPKAATQYVTVKGSDTMVHLVSAWAEAYMKANPHVNISVTGGGSGTGIAALINGTTDICAASREMKASEVEKAKANGVEPVETAVASDGIAVIVNPGNPVSELTQDQIGKIYTGAYTNWKEVGGPDGRIVVLSRESSSGTYVFFQEHVLKMKDYTPEARLLPATSAIIQSVSSDKWAIGYVGLGYASEAAGRVKVLRVKASETGRAVMPSEATVKSGEYPIARPLFLYTGANASSAVKAFLAYTLSVAGQKIVTEGGYVAIK